MVYKCDNVDKIEKAVKKDYNADIDVSGCLGAVYRFVKDQRYVIAMLLLDNSPGVVAHEAVHVLHSLQESFEVETALSSSEWCAHMIEYIVDSVLDNKGYKLLKKTKKSGN